MVLKVLTAQLLLLIGLSSIATAQCINTFPNTETFESGPVWTVGGTNSDWTWGTPSKPVITGAGGGTKCWVTAGLTGSVYNNSEQAYIVSPCYNFSALTYPHVKFKIFWETEYKYDGGNLQYSINSGTTWINVGAVNDPVNCMTANWYNYASITYLNNPVWITTKHGWAGNIQASYPSGVTTCQGGNGSGAWVVAQHCLNGLAGQPNVIFRFTYGSGTTCNSYDGLAIDDFTIENGPPNAPTFTFTCTGANTASFTSVNPPCPTPSTYSWNFGDPASGASNTSAAVFPTHTFSAPGVYTVTLTTTGGPCNPPGSFSLPVTILSASTTITNVTCNGGNNGTATANVNGGVAPYTYSWTPGVQTTSTATGLSAGTYTVNISAVNSCPAAATATITQPAPLTATTTITPVKCFGGSDGTATASPTGGTAPYTYSWAPSGGNTVTATGLSIGTYTVTVKDLNNCTITQTAVVTQPASALSATASNTPVGCFGGNNGSVTVTPSGGNAPYSYSWSPSVSTTNTASGLSAGTYSITITDSHNCIFTVTSTVAQPASGLTVSTTSTPVSCLGGSNGTVTATPVNGVAPYSYSWTPSVSTSATASGLTAGTYAVNITDGSGCSATGSGTVTQPASAISVTANVTPVSCFGGNNGSITAIPSNGTAPYSYSWNPASGTTSTTSGLIAGTYTVTVSDANGCSTTSPTTIPQPTQLNTSISVTAVNCFGGNDGKATVTPTGGTSPYIYAWAPSGGNAATATGLNAATYTVTITDFNNCTVTQTATIIQPAAALSVTATNTPVSCFGGNNGTITTSSSGGTAPYIYSWSPAVSTSANATGLTAGTYIINIADSHGCISNTSTSVTQPTAFSISTVNTPVSCFGGSNGTVTVSPINGTSPYTYSWNPSVSISAAATGLTAGTYSVSATDNNGCIATASSIVTQPSLALALSATNTSVSCFGGSNGSITATPANGVAPFTYIWNPSVSNVPTATGLTAGQYTITVNDSNGCSAITQSTITQPTAVSASLSNTPVSCFGGSNGTATTYVTGGTSPYAYSWAPSAGSSVTASGLIAGTYSVTITDVNNCSITANTTITQPSGPLTVSSVHTNVSCFGGNNGSMTVNATGGTAPYSYLWLPAVGSTSPGVTGLVAGTYSVNVTDANGCTAVTSSNVTQPVSALNASTTSTPSLCILHNGTATATAVGGTDPYTYSWAPSGGTSSSATALSSGTYTVTVTDINNCVIHPVITVNDTGAIAVSITTTPISCFGDTNGTALAIVNGGTAPYAYIWNNGSTTPGLINLGSGNYCVRATDANGCSDSTCIALIDPPQINAEFSSDPTVTDLSNPVINFIDQSSNAYSWQWNFGDLGSSVNENPAHTYNNAGTYLITLIVTTPLGCVDTVAHTIVINDIFTFYAPNAFTPDGNGLNEIFLPKGTYWDPSKFNLWIFDRWGNMIFHSTDMNKGWDGKANGGSDIAQIDVYVWKAQLSDLSGHKHSYIGSVTIVK